VDRWPGGNCPGQLGILGTDSFSVFEAQQNIFFGGYKMRGTYVVVIVLLTATTWAQEKTQTSATDKNEKSAAVKFQPLNVKTGLWQNTMTTALAGQMVIPPERLAKLTPEQRARIEAAMNARSSQGAKTTTYQSCVTKDELQKTPFRDKKNCTETLVSSSNTQAEVKLACAMEGVDGSGEMQIHAISDESIAGSGHGTVTMQGRTMNTSWKLTGKWMGESCGGVK
jgi:uncharacterized protein DUF3617